MQILLAFCRLLEISQTILVDMSSSNVQDVKECSDAKCPKLEDANGSGDSSWTSLKGAKLVSVLNEKRSQKAVFLHGRFGDDPQDAVIILEKKPFDTSTEAMSLLLCENTQLKGDLKNDIYATFDAVPQVQNALKATVIYPATKKHIKKYTRQSMYVIQETSEDYQKITKPFLDRKFDEHVFSVEWVYNILEHKAEVDRIIFEDRDPHTGFILVPDMKWDITSEKESLYLIALPHKRGIRSLRDLTAEHIPLLENIQTQALKAIDEKFGVKSDRLRVYFHYQPSFYHLHVHINHIELDIPGTSTHRAHLLTDVISNLQLCSDYYQKKTFTMTLQENDLLLAALQEGFWDPRQGFCFSLFM